MIYGEAVECNPAMLEQDGLMSQIVSDIAGKLMEQKEEQIKAAIDHKIGKLWSMDDIKGRGELRNYPDKTEVFTFDGVELIRFYPIETRIEQEEIRTVFKGELPYDLLYK